MTISKDRVKPSPTPDSWKLAEIFTTGIAIGTYLALMTVLFFHLAYKTDFFQKFHVEDIKEQQEKLHSAVYLQVSIISQALIFVTRSRGFSFMERPGFLLFTAFLIAQLVATVLAAEADWPFCHIKGIGWKWSGVIWLFNLVTYFPLDWIKFAVRYILSGKAWSNLIERKVAFTTQKDFGKEAREVKWAHAQRTLHGLQPKNTRMLNERSTFHELNEMAEQAMRRAEIARLRELHTLKGHVEAVLRLKDIDVGVIAQSYTV